jgi:CheY-like chemotaxis protein
MGNPVLLLLVDDDKEDQRFIQLAVERGKTIVKIEFVNNGLEALDLLNLKPEFKPDFILLDINMPLMNGLECLREMKRTKRLGYSKVYIYSTFVNEENIKAYMELGAHGVIRKVPSVAALATKLDSIFMEAR